MSACSILHRRDAVAIVTDSVECDWSTGVVQRHRSKVLELPAASAVLVYRGLCFPPIPGFIDNLDGCASFEALVSGLGDIARDLHSEAKKRFSDPFGRDIHFELTIAGMAAEGPSSWSLHTDPDIDPEFLWEGYEPFVPAELFPLWIRPGIGDLENLLRRAGANPPIASIEEFFEIDLESFATGILEAQRLLDLPFITGGPAIRGVGGFGELVVVSAEGVRRQYLKLWPDHIGRPIEPGTDRGPLDADPIALSFRQAQQTAPHHQRGNPMPASTG